jgi:N-methylhydantoinase B
MTNTLNTPVEALELAYPFRIVAYTLREGTGGSGKFRGGDGVRRTYEFLAPATCTLMTDRRLTEPYGLQGGGPGARGHNRLVRADGTVCDLPPKVTFHVGAGDLLEIDSPGGGGWGGADDRPPEP